jgi:hypothetical protein
MFVYLRSDGRDTGNVRKVISASRRTDVPAFYTRWFLNRITAGFCHWINPFGGQVKRVSMLPEDTYGIVFWTRFAKPLIPHLQTLDERGYEYYFHVTINGYDRALEARNPETSVAVECFQRLSDRISPRRALWRYDPIVLSVRTPPADHVRRFASLARALSGYTERCYFSFADAYGKTKRNLQTLEKREKFGFYEGAASERKALVSELATIGAAHGIRLYACCEDALAGGMIGKAHCVETELLGGGVLKPSPSRAECGCVESVDIGAYDTCQFGCVYCYATNSWEAARRRALAHDPADTALWRPATLVGRNLAELAAPRGSKEGIECSSII